MKYSSILLFILLLSLNSCTRRHKSDNLHYYQDFEAVKGWFPIASISSEVKAHSGNYSARTDPYHLYSPVFSSIISDISKQPLKKIKASVWCYSTSMQSEGVFCLQINTPAKESKLWIGKAFKDFILTENKWTYTTIEIDIPAEAMAPENEVGVYIWNQGKHAVYVDDLAVEFSEK